jgi:hypothetical protein
MMAASAAFSQYKVEPAGPPPADLPAAISGVLQKDGAKVVGAGGKEFCSIWFVAKAPSGPKSPDDGVALPTVPQGALMGAIRFPAAGSDRRGQAIKPGTYTLRYSQHPVNGDHQGVAPQRDFLLMSPAADDTNATATPAFNDLVAMSRKASGTPHPAVLSASSSSKTTFPSIDKEGDSDWVLNAKAGDLPIALIVVGRAE